MNLKKKGCKDYRSDSGDLKLHFVVSVDDNHPQNLLFIGTGQSRFITSYSKSHY